jgi:putative hemolysin
MHSFPWGDIAIILGLITLNGFFAGAELAIVSSRPARLQALAQSGRRGAETAIRLASEPGRFLSTVQIGITLVGIASGAYSGASLAGPAGELLAGAGVPAALSAQVGFVLVIVAVTYVTLIVGELVPKQLALRAPERIACTVAPFMAAMTLVLAPFVLLLDASSAAVFPIFGLARESREQVTEEELRSLVAEAESAGVIEVSERELISGIMRLADRQVRGVMTPRVDVDWIDLAASPEVVKAVLTESPHTRLPVADGTVDRIIGVIQARDAMVALLEGRPLDLAALARQAPVVPDVSDASVALAALRDSPVPMAIVVDEYGHFEGVVTPADLLAAIAGEFRSDIDEGNDPAIVTREDGSLLVAGSVPVDEMAELLGFRLEDERDYHTAAGFVLAELEHIPRTGEQFEAHGYRFEVVDMDGRKIDRLLVSRIAA